MTSKLTHRKQTNQDPKSSDHIILFAEAGNDHYGEHCWTLHTELPTIPDAVVEFAAEFYGIDIDAARELVNPDKIVSDAGAWDDPDFVSEIWHFGPAYDVKGYRTYDGAVVFPGTDVDLEYSIDEE